MLLKENWRAGVLLALLSLSVLLPNSMLSNWYGASSFVGRYQWAIVSLWVFPLAHAVKLLFKYRLLFLLPLCLVALLLQAWMASRWLYTDGLLINTGWPVWAAKNFYSESPALLLRLPFFKNVNDYTNLKDCLTHPANYACLILSAALVMTGWLWPRRATRTLPGVWSLSLIAVVCLLAFVPPAVPSWYITADALPSEVGAQGYQSRSAHEGETRAGHLVFGPYVTLMSGTYRVMLEYEADDNQARPHLDIVYDIQTRVIPYQDLPPSSANNGKFESEFQVDEEISMQKQFEFRVWYPGKGNLMVKRLNLAYLHP